MTDQTLTVSAVTEVTIRVGGLPEKFAVKADSRRSDPVTLSYRPALDLPTKDIYFTTQDAKAIGQALIDAAGAMDAQLRQLRDRGAEKEGLSR